MPTTILDDVLLALEETAAESKPERAALLLAAHNEIVRSHQKDQEDILRHQMAPGARAAQPRQRRPTYAEIDNREDPEE